MQYRLPFPASVVLATAALLTGCGGSSRDQKANDAYASGVCTALGSWLTEVENVDTIPPSGTTKASIDGQLVTSARGESNSAKAVASTILANGSTTELVGALAALPDFQTLKATTQQTLALGAHGSLASAFKSAQTCKKLG